MDDKKIIALGFCGRCQRQFTFDPKLVASFKDDQSPTAETDPLLPICLRCVELVNPQRTAKGLEPFTVLPGAYPGEEGNR